VVLLNVLVDKTGHPQKIDIKKSSGSKMLDKAAVEGVWQWTFQAAKFGAIPVESKVDIPIRFRLNEK
jgi:protein TonB